MLLSQTGIVRLFLFSTCIGTYENEEKSFDNFWEKQVMNTKMFSSVAGVFILIGLILSGLISYISNSSYWVGSFWGWIIWIISFGLNIKHFMIIPDPNYGIILQDTLISLFGKPAVIVEADGIERPVGQRAVFTGINFRWPWEIAVGKPIHVTKVAPLSGRVERIAKGGQEIIVTWIGALTPLTSPDLIMFERVDADSVVAIFKAEIDKEIANLISNEDGGRILAEKGDYFENRVTELYGGKKLVAKERASGRNVNSITISSVTADVATQKALNVAANATKFAEAIRKLVAAAGPNPLAQTMALAAGLGSEIPASVIPIITPQGGRRGGRNNNQGNQQGQP